MISKRNWLVLMVLVIGMISLIGCSSGEDSDADTTDSEQEADEQQEGQEEPSAELSTDEELTQQLESEDAVEEAMVQLVDEEEGQLVNIDINISADQEWSEDLKTTYSEIIQEAYPDQTVDVIFAQDGEMLEQITLE
ncbi:hypothetical protein D7Z54_02125 [Salibacterium salarium]|uniref:Sporulation lipoprotein YhcN/YlaJ (Spore_YhcN_YlaJ) n=1 Tax=Salibacterium salarium TaxID=284579 RepID=A0A3R9P8R8_9BACI|nr:hypothetical protein [Salibacterium salarium]RSL35383.1 hypothetical protein D7Z54_02125 [Salibacterium salarium]